MPRETPPLLACTICGCTEEHACEPFGCMWMARDPPICSQCFRFLMNIRDETKQAGVLAVFELPPWRNLITRINETGPG